MLPVTHGVAFTRLQVLLYTVLLIAVTLMPFVTGMSGLIYLAAALVLNAHVHLLCAADEDHRTRAPADEGVPLLDHLPDVAVRGAARRSLSTHHAGGVASGHHVLLIRACTPPLTLPARFNGQFGLVLYYQHHGVLLLRSGDRDDGGPKRIDLLFRGVVWMSLPAWFSDFTVEQCLLDEVLEYIPPSHRAKAESRKVYPRGHRPHAALRDRRQRVRLSDDGSYFDPSPLLPEIEVNPQVRRRSYDLRAFH